MITGTLLYTWLFGTWVGKDEFGNRYFKGSAHKKHGKERRWVLYKGDREASKVPAEWHAWLHHMVDDPLTQEAADPHSWQKPHKANQTGTMNAYRPKGHEVLGGTQGGRTGTYEAWQPND